MISFITLADSKEPAFFAPENDGANFVEKGDAAEIDSNEDEWYNENNIIDDDSHLLDGKLRPNVKYKAGEYNYIYRTDEFGRISDVHVEELYYTERDERLKYNSNTPEKENEDHAGHLIGDRFGGSPNLDNLVSQSSFVNLSEYKTIENKWAAALDRGQKVSVEIDVKYIDNSMRPAEFCIKYSIDGEKEYKNIKNQRSK